MAQVEFTPVVDAAQEPSQVEFGPVDMTKPDPVVLDQRAQKYDFAMQATSPGLPALRQNLDQGATSDDLIRQSMVANKAVEDDGHRLAVIQAIGQMRQGPVTQDEMDTIRGLQPTDKRGRNPRVILEDEYARQFMNYITTASQGLTSLAQKVSENGDEDHLFRATDISQMVKAKNEVTLKTLQDYEAKYKQEGWASTIGNAALDLIPGYSAWSTSRMLPNIPSDSFFPGSSLSQKLRSLHLLSTDDYERVLSAEMKRMYEKNPGEAMRLLRSVHTYTTSDAGIANAFAVLDIAGATQFIPGRALTKLTSAVEKASITAGRGMTADELNAARVGTGIVQGESYASRTVREPRSMNANELAQANIVPPGPSSFTPQAIKEMADKLSPKAVSEADIPRLMTIQELERAKVGPTGRLLTPDEMHVMKTRLELANAYKDVLKASSAPQMDVGKAFAGAGDLGAAAMIDGAREAAMNLAGKDGIKNFSERVQSFLNPTRVDDSTALALEGTKRVAAGLTSNAKALVGAILDPVKIRRTPDNALIAGLKETEAQLQQRYTHVNDSILDIKWNLGRAPEDLKNFPQGKVQSLSNPTNTASVDIFMGKPDATLFDTEAQAKFWGNVQYKIGKDAFSVEPQGGKWAIKVSKDVDETTDAVRQLTVQTESKTQPSLWNVFIGSLRSSQDLTSLLNSESRVLVTHGSQAMQSIMKEVAQNIGTLTKQEYKNMKAFFAADRDFRGPDQIPGRFLETAGQFETEYTNMFKKLPSEKEIQAYFSYRQLNDFDYVVRNLGLYRDLSRLGVEHVRFKFADRETGAKKFTEYFLGRERKDLPLGPNSPGAGVYVFDNNTQVGKTYRVSKLDAKGVAEINRKIRDDGYKVYELADPLSRPLKLEAGVNDYVNFVVVKDVSTKQLPYDLIPYQAGGHREYATQWFAKQADITRLGGRYNYQGDKTLLGQYTQAEAQVYVAALNKARELVKNKDWAALDIHAGQTLPWTGKEIRDKFNTKTWDVNEPFHTTFTGQSVRDVDKAGLQARYGDKLHDEANSPYNLMSQVDKKFLGDRDPALATIKDKGTERAPQFSVEDAPLIDPLKSLNRTVSNVVHQRLISDYKWQSVETFMADFGHFMDIPIDTFRQSPLYWLQNPKWAKTPDAAGLATAKAQRQAILSFMSMDSPDVRALKWMQQKGLDLVYDKLGQGTSDYVAEHLLTTVTDPFKYARNLAFHSKLGLFNPVQLLNQLQTLTHVTALSGPVVASKAMVGASLMTMLRMTENPKMIAHFDDIATKFGWKPGQLTHAYQEMRRSGWNLVQGETSWRDDVADPQMFKSAWGKFLDAGAIFFTEGERFTRTSAWAASYLENMAKTEVRHWNDQTLQKTLARADLMNVNMTRASQSPLQQGALGATTQFWTYNLRLMEQMWGGRLTQAEKARVLATYSAMYGIPATTGVAVAFWPMYDSMRTSALERNADGSGTAWDNSATRALMEGLPAEMIKIATGKNTNYAERFGPAGVTGISDFLTGEKSWWEFLTGVSGSTVKDLATAMSPIAQSLWSAVKGESAAFPFVLEDLVDPAKSISSVNLGFRAYYAANYMKFLTKSGVPIGDADKVDAILTGFGLTRRDMADVFKETKSLKTLKAAQDEMQKTIVKEMQRAYQSALNADDTEARRHIMRAQHYFKMGDFNPGQLNEIMQQAQKGYLNIQDKVKFDFFFKKAPASQVQQRKTAIGMENNQ